MHPKLKLASPPTCLCSQEDQITDYVLQLCPLHNVTREDVWTVSNPRDDQTLRLQAGAGEDDFIHLPSGLDRVAYKRQKEEDRVSARIDWREVGILWLGEIECLTCNLCLNAPARTMSGHMRSWASLTAYFWDVKQHHILISGPARRFRVRARMDWREVRTLWLGDIQVCLSRCVYEMH